MSDTTYQRLMAEMMTVATPEERKVIWDRHLKEQQDWQQFIADKNHEQYERGLKDAADAVARWESRGVMRFLYPKPSTFSLELVGRYPKAVD